MWAAESKRAGPAGQQKQWPRGFLFLEKRVGPVARETDKGDSVKPEARKIGAPPRGIPPPPSFVVRERQGTTDSASPSAGTPPASPFPPDGHAILQRLRLSASSRVCSRRQGSFTFCAACSQPKCRVLAAPNKSYAEVGGPASVKRIRSPYPRARRPTHVDAQVPPQVNGTSMCEYHKIFSYRLHAITSL